MLYVHTVTEQCDACNRNACLVYNCSIEAIYGMKHIVLNPISFDCIVNTSGSEEVYIF